jgi:alpha-tubulin suppressor-like RCC1 family protein
VKAVDEVTGIEPKFKRIQFLGDSDAAIMFAALDTEDSLWVWGNSVDGAFGNGQLRTIGPTKLYAFDKNVLDFQITCSATNVSLISIITKDNKLFSAGDNTFRQLGRGDTAATSPTLAYSILRQCKKGASTLVDDAKKIIVSNETGSKNNLYISVLGEVWACGDNNNGVLGRGVIAADSEYFAKVDNLTNITYLLGIANNNYANHIIFALKDDGTLWSWGYNGAAAGQSLTNDITNATINAPTQCYSFETQDVVRNATNIFGNDNAATNQSTVAYLDEFGDLYLGGYSTEAEVPLFPATIPYFRKFNMRNILPDVNLVGEAAAIHRTNGTVYSINKFGAKKLF